MLARLRALAGAEPIAAAAAAIAAGGAAATLGAWFFQYGLGLAPCPLCLEQRTPHYVAIPLAVLVAVAAWRGAPRPVLTGGLAMLALLMLWSAYLGAYHAGVEWKWWAGPQDCAVAPTGLGAGGSLLQQMQQTRVVPGVEWKWWAGPQECAVAPGGGLGTAGGLLQQMQQTRVVPCDEAAWRFLGLSLAGWNFLISLALAGTAIVGMGTASRNWTQHDGNEANP
jgi:disulfide bond formation protein DsbB